MANNFKDQFIILINNAKPHPGYWKIFLSSCFFLVMIPMALVFLFSALNHFSYFHDNEFFVDGLQTLKSLSDAKYFNFFGVIALESLGWTMLCPKKSYLAQTTSIVADGVFCSGMMGLGSLLGGIVVEFFTVPDIHWPSSGQVLFIFLGVIFIAVLNYPVFLIKMLTAPRQGSNRSVFLEFLAKNPSVAQKFLGVLFILCPVWAVLTPKNWSLLMMIGSAMAMTVYIEAVKFFRVDKDEVR